MAGGNLGDISPSPEKAKELGEDLWQKAWEETRSAIQNFDGMISGIRSLYLTLVVGIATAGAVALAAPPLQTQIEAILYLVGTLVIAFSLLFLAVEALYNGYLQVAVSVASRIESKLKLTIGHLGISKEVRDFVLFRIREPSRRRRSLANRFSWVAWNLPQETKIWPGLYHWIYILPLLSGILAVAAAFWLAPGTVRAAPLEKWIVPTTGFVVTAGISLPASLLLVIHFFVALPNAKIEAWLKAEESPVYFFAYGNDMDPEEFKKKGLQYTGEPRRARLKDYVLEFNKLATGRRAAKGEGKANLVKSPGGRVQGVLYTLKGSELGTLDVKEGVEGGHYYREEVTEHLHDEKSVPAFAYLAEPAKTMESAEAREKLRPTDEYLDRMLGGGDLLPPHYSAALRKLKAASSAPPEVYTAALNELQKASAQDASER